MKKKEKKRKRSAEKNVDEREAPRTNVPKTRSSRLSSTTPRWRECRRTNRTARPFRWFSSGEFFIKRRDNSKIKKRMLQHARQKLIRSQKKKISLLFFKESDRHTESTLLQKSRTQKKQISDVIWGKKNTNGRRFLRGKISAPPRLPLLRRRKRQGEEKERKSWE